MKPPSKLLKYKCKQKTKILTIIITLQLTLLLSVLPKKYNPKRFWVRNIYRRRENHGAYRTLVQELKEKNPDEGRNENFFNYCRMIPKDFEELLALVSPHIKKQNVFRESIPPEERLAVTLRYLASGDMMTSLGFSFRMGNSTISNIIRETTTAIWNVLSKEVFPVYTSEQWLKISAKLGKWRDINANDSGISNLFGRSSNDPAKTGVQVRETLKNYFMNEETINWQYKNIL